MIHTALQFITHELNEYLKIRLDSSAPGDEKIVLTNVATPEGVVIPEKSLGLSLINIEEERVTKEQKTSHINNDGRVERINPEIKLNLYILVTANFQGNNNDTTADYSEGLKQLSYVISFFQSKNVFTDSNSPALSGYDPNIKKLIVELYSYSFEQLYNFWTVVGTNYLPSILYKIRVLSIQEKAIQDINLPIEKIGINTGGR